MFQVYAEKTFPSTLLATNIGNMYTASLYSSLISLLVNVPSQNLLNKKVGLFSYGSGLAACMFSLSLCPSDGEQKQATEEKFFKLIGSLSSVKERLMGRKEVAPQRFVEVIETRELIEKDKEFVPKCGSDDLWPGTYSLKRIDEKLRRFYERKSAL